MPNDSSSTFSPLNPTADEPLYRQIYDRIRTAIASGVLKPGDRVPSARALTKELGLARGTIEGAYSLLAAEGYIEARGQAGTIVSPDLKPRPALAVPPARPEKRPLSTPVEHRDGVLPLQLGLPALDEFPRKIWARLGARCVRAMQPSDMARPSPFGLQPLREAIAAYLQVARGIDCSPAQIFVTSGYTHTLSMIAHALFKPGDRVLLENPGYPPTRQLLDHMQILPAFVPVDSDGMVVSEALKIAPRARAAVVTPAHQSPLGVSLSLPRRLNLLDWASRTNSWIVEDDYDGEYRYVSRPLPALKSLDREGRVLYAGTFSKVLFPSIRLAYLVVPVAQVERFEEISHVLVGGSPELTQQIVSDFIAEGHFARHIQRMRKLYGERRQLATASLERILAGRAKIDSQPGGMHIILRLMDGQSDQALVERMHATRLHGEALTDWTVGSNCNPALLLSFTNINSAEMAESLATKILNLL